MKRLDVEKLDSLGFFRYASPTERAASINAARTGSFAFAHEHRLYHADAESLAEQGVRDFFGAVAPFLRRAGVPIEVTYRPVKTVSGGKPRIAPATLTADGWLDENGPSSSVETLRLSLHPGAPMCDVTEDDLELSSTYLLFLGDRELVIFKFEDGEEWDGWRAATRSTLELLNELLTSHGSAERAYALSSGNGLQIAFVTPEMAQIINDAAASDDRLYPGWAR